MIWYTCETSQYLILMAGTYLSWQYISYKIYFYPHIVSEQLVSVPCLATSCLTLMKDPHVHFSSGKMTSSPNFSDRLESFRRLLWDPSMLTYAAPFVTAHNLPRTQVILARGQATHWRSFNLKKGWLPLWNYSQPSLSRCHKVGEINLKYW